MSEYLVTMRLEFEGVSVTVTADSEEEARTKAQTLDWTGEPDICTAELVNWQTRTVAPNE